MNEKGDEEELLHNAALQNARSILLARERAEESLRKQTEWLRVTLASIGDAVISTDAEGRITFLNAVAEKLTGWKSSESMGRPLPDVFQIVNEHTRQPTDNPALRALREGAIVGLANHTILIARDGTERPIEDSASPMLDVTGSILGTVLVFRDATERRRSERALSESRARLDYAARLSGLGFWYCDLPFDELVWDERVKEHFWLPKEAQVTIDLFYERLHPEDRELTRQAIEESIRERLPYAVDYRTVDPATNAIKWIRALGGTAYAPDGTPTRFDGVTVDITARKLDEIRLARALERETEQAKLLREQDRRKDEFLALLAHELRNPLAPLRNGLQILHLTGNDPVMTADTRAMMDRQLSHMVRLIDDLLDISRINRDKMELRRERILLADVVSNAVETARPLLDEGGHTLTVDLPPGPVYLDGDLTRLAQVFSNLFTNSAKYTPHGGRIHLQGRRHGEVVDVSVRDNGIGIPAGDLPRIFDMFAQVNRTFERAAGGLGIGLALVRALVKMHGGIVWAESEGQGRGSTFTVRLPVVKEACDRSSLEKKSDDPVARDSGRRVLVVDDSTDGATSIAMLLRLMGHEVRIAHDGVEAVTSAETFRPEVILMDVGMPRLNGLDATRRIREQSWGKDISIWALTGWGQESDQERSRAAGCDGHMVKPVNLQDLKSVLRSPAP